MKISPPHTTRYISAISYIPTFGQSFVQRHTQEVYAVVKCTNEEVNLRTIMIP